jgi:hypothetical protein
MLIVSAIDLPVAPAERQSNAAARHQQRRAIMVTTTSGPSMTIYAVTRELDSLGIAQVSVAAGAVCLRISPRGGTQLLHHHLEFEIYERSTLPLR